MPQIRTWRVYAHEHRPDGRPVLVDRIWPRGLSKADLSGVLWLKDVGPSTALRKWFGHDPAKWDEFRRRYFAELAANPALATLEDLVRQGPVTLLYGAHDESHNNAVALAQYLGRERG